MSVNLLKQDTESQLVQASVFQLFQAFDLTVQKVKFPHTGQWKITIIII